MGLVTRSSTSLADAPGIWTKTSIIGTMICGSSSRGSRSTAPMPSKTAAAMMSGVSLELMNACARRPAGPSAGFISLNSASIDDCVDAIDDDPFSFAQSSQHLYPVAVGLAGLDQSHTSSARIVHYEHADQLTALDDCA